MPSPKAQKPSQRQELLQFCDQHNLFVFIDTYTDKQVGNLLSAYKHLITLTEHPRSEFTLFCEILSHPNDAQHLPKVFKSLTDCGGTPSTTPHLFYLCARHAAIADSLCTVFDSLHKREINPRTQPRPYTEGIESAYYLSRFPEILTGLIANTAPASSSTQPQSQLFSKKPARKKAKPSQADTHESNSTAKFS